MEAEAERRAELKRAADLVGLALAVAEVNAGNVNLGQLSQLIVGQKFDERRRREAQRPSERGMLSYCKARQVRSVCRSPQRGALSCLPISNFNLATRYAVIIKHVSICLVFGPAASILYWIGGGYLPQV